MSQHRTAFVLLVALALGGCAAPPRDEASSPAPPTARPADEPAPASADATLPTPYTAGQIRAANPPGTRLRMRVEAFGQTPVLREIAFVGGDAEHASMEGRMLSIDGEPIAPMIASTATWTDLRDHASFPAAAATRSRTTVDVTTGSFEAWRYDVRDASGDPPTTTSYFFAVDRPGPPVLIEQRDDAGRLLMRMEMVGDSR